MSITKEIVDFCSNLTFKDFPFEAVDKVKSHALDFVGVAARGSLTDSAKVMYALIKDIGLSQKRSVVTGTVMKTSPHYAALANGTSSHSLELDDVNNEASLHPGVVIFPAAFAASELAGCNGERFIEGVISGYEIMIRLGKALNPARHYAQGFHPTGTCGVFGAAIATSKILNLNKEQMLNALGIAGSQAAGSMEFLTNGAWTKRMHPGWAAHSGILAALLAQKGFKGPSTMIEGENGFLHSYSDGSDSGKVLCDLGKSFEIVKTSIKLHACCRYKHGPIDGVLKIMKENNLEAREIKEVILGILKAGFPIIAEPKELKCNPKTVVDAQFSMPFGAAVAVLYGRASLGEYTQERIDSSEVKEMMNRVSCIEDPELEKVYPRMWPATAKIVMQDGRKLTAKIDYPKGDPENPLSWEEVTEKFNQLSSPVYPRDKRAEIISRIRAIEAEKNISDLSALFLMEAE